MLISWKGIYTAFATLLAKGHAVCILRLNMGLWWYCLYLWHQAVCCVKMLSERSDYFAIIVIQILTQHLDEWIHNTFTSVPRMRCPWKQRLLILMNLFIFQLSCELVSLCSMTLNNLFIFCAPAVSHVILSGMQEVVFISSTPDQLSIKYNKGCKCAKGWFSHWLLHFGPHSWSISMWCGSKVN